MLSLSMEVRRIQYDRMPLAELYAFPITTKILQHAMAAEAATNPKKTPASDEENAKEDLQFWNLQAKMNVNCASVPEFMDACEHLSVNPHNPYLFPKPTQTMSAAQMEKERKNFWPIPGKSQESVGVFTKRMDRSKAVLSETIAGWARPSKPSALLPPACRQSELVASHIWQITQARDLVKRAWLISPKANGNDMKADDPFDPCRKLIWGAGSSKLSLSRSLIGR